MDLVTVFRICFVVGILAIPILYVLFVRGGAAGHNQNRARSEESVERERRSEERSPS